jgi:hypothetical protein
VHLVVAGDDDVVADEVDGAAARAGKTADEERRRADRTIEFDADSRLRPGCR